MADLRNRSKMQVTSHALRVGYSSFYQAILFRPAARPPAPHLRPGRRSRIQEIDMPKVRLSSKKSKIMIWGIVCEGKSLNLFWHLWILDQGMPES